MLEIRPVCENCGRSLPANSTEAMICSFECTFCADCVKEILHNVCPNCGGGLERRPIRPKEKLIRYPASDKPVVQPVDMDQFTPLLAKTRPVDPADR